MPLPTPDDLKSMSFSFGGQPFVSGAADQSIALKTMAWPYQGQPFVANCMAYKIKKLAGAAYSGLKTILGTIVAEIKKLGGAAAQ